MSKIQPYFLGLTWLPKLGPIRALSRIYRLRKKPRVSKGHELPGGGPATCPPEVFWNVYARRCNLVHFEKCYSVCTAFVASGWFFRYSYFYTVMITLFWVGKLGVLGGELLPLKYPRQSPVNTVHLPGADVHSWAEWVPATVGTGFLWGCFGCNCAQMAPGGTESDFGMQGWIRFLGLKQIFLIFSV